jgi:acetate---CoA ligase (ADP-forming)
MGERLIQEAVEHFRAAHVPEYRFPERAASVLAVLAQRAEHLRRAEQAVSALYPVQREQAKRIVDEATGAYEPGDFLPAQAVTQLIQAYGIPTPPLRLAHSAADAANLAQEVGMPVVLKVASPDILHKSDANGILLNLGDANAAALGYQEVVENVRRALPAARILGVHVQRMVPGGQEVIIGAVQDAQFGPLVMFGSGGVEVEGLKDVAFALAPMTGEEAEFLLESTWAGKKLAGFRGAPPADRAAALETLQRLAQLAADFPQITEIEINPLRVLAAGMGVCAIDARARLA